MSKIKDLMGLLLFMNDRKQPVLEKVFKKDKSQDARANVQKQNFVNLSDQKEGSHDFNKSKP